MKPNLIDAEIERVLGELKKLDPKTDDYTKAADNLKVLYETRSKRTAWIVEPEVLLTVGAGILEVVMVLYHERLEVITSKAFGLIRFK